MGTRVICVLMALCSPAAVRPQAVTAAAMWRGIMHHIGGTVNNYTLISTNAQIYSEGRRRWLFNYVDTVESWLAELRFEIICHFFKNTVTWKSFLMTRRWNCVFRWFCINMLWDIVLRWFNSAVIKECIKVTVSSLSSLVCLDVPWLTKHSNHWWQPTLRN